MAVSASAGLKVKFVDENGRMVKVKAPAIYLRKKGCPDPLPHSAQFQRGTNSEGYYIVGGTINREYTYLIPFQYNGKVYEWSGSLRDGQSLNVNVNQCRILKQ